MWIRHGKTGVVVLVKDPAHITRLLEEGGVQVDGPDATDTPPISLADARARKEEAEERIAAVATKIKADEKRARPTRKR